MAEITLDDILKAPTDHEELAQHLLGQGWVQPPPAPVEPPPTVAPAEISSPLSPARAKSDVAEMKRPTIPMTTGVNIDDAPSTREMEGFGSAPIGGTPPPSLTAPSLSPIMPKQEIAPSLAEHGMTPDISVAPMTPPAAPTKKESIEAGKYEYNLNRPVINSADPIEKQEETRRLQIAYDRLHPLGSDVSRMPGTKGKILHTLGQIGQIAGGAIAPGVIEQIPGTERNRVMEDERLAADIGKTKELNLAERGEATKEKIAENTADLNEQKMENAQTKLETEWAKIGNVRERDLRRQGLMPNPLDPKGQPVAIPYDAMSPTEQGVYDLKQAQVGAADARAALDKIKADPDSPQSKALLERVRVMAQNAGTAAEKLGLQKKEYIAKYFGLDDNGDPIPGVQTTPEGKPIGPAVANSGAANFRSFNKDYVKPAEDVEQSFQMFENAYAQHKAGKDPTGAQGMLALSTHLATTFGNVKGSRITKDMIQHHLGARSISDDMLVAVQKLTNGDPLAPQQWDAFRQLIGESRKLKWTAAAKEAPRYKQQIDFLPKDLQGELNPKAATGANTNAAPPPPRVARPGFKWQYNAKLNQHREVPVNQ